MQFDHADMLFVTGLKYRFIVVAVYRNQVYKDSQPSVRTLLDPDFGDEETVPTTGNYTLHSALGLLTAIMSRLRCSVLLP